MSSLIIHSIARRQEDVIDIRRWLPGSEVAPFLCVGVTRADLQSWVVRAY